MGYNFASLLFRDYDFERRYRYSRAQYTAGFYSERILKEAKPEIVAEAITGQIISVTGYNHENDLIQDPLRKLGGILGDKDIWQEEQFVVIGRFGFDEEYLKRSIEVGLYIKKPFNYISIEDFFFYLVFGELRKYCREDHRIFNHPALAFLASVGFKWPSTFGSPGAGGSLNHDWSPSSRLASRYGYTVRAGVSERKRHDALSAALSDKNGLSLQSVVEHIAFLVRINKRRWDSNMDDAIDRWESDLDWLYERYYKGSIFSFIWPDY